MSISDHLAKINLKGVLAGVVGAALVFNVTDIISTNIIEDGIEPEFALTIIQLTALTLPALAILLQASLSYSDQPRFRLSDETRDMQKSFFILIGISSTLLVMSVATVFHSVNLSRGLSFSLMFIILALLVFVAIPVIIGMYEHEKQDQDFPRLIQATEFAKYMDEIEDVDEKHLINSLERFDLEHLSSETSGGSDEESTGKSDETKEKEDAPEEVPGAE